MTVSAGRKAPISFFNPLKFIPVFPPTAASTAPNRVVGILMKRIPLLKQAAAKPPKSVTIPPPKLIRSDFLLAPLAQFVPYVNECLECFMGVAGFDRNILSLCGYVFRYFG